MEFKKEFEANKKQWNARVEGHVASKMYDVEGFMKGETSLKKVELAGIGDLTGKRILHLQCHFGLDTLSLARLGAETVGLDISDTAIDKANEIRDELGLNASFVCSNLYDIRDHLSTEEKFDMVFVSYGAVCWLPDLKEWGNIIDDYLKEGGEFYMVEMHPYIYTLNWDTFKPEYNYFNKEVYEEMVETSYDGETPLNLPEYFWIHSLQEMMAPFLSKGYQLKTFQEHNYQTYDCFDDMIEKEEGEFVFRKLGVDIPYMIELKFKK
ncbi:bifunctional 2-polyprenyl-6-hydroxyphenol methylase/3-demethylubiquinol 3-O-methyltransferase UbiG [Flammeovirga sp. EKP202]|uniref:class I SAM-dependent methyltransferase n=1 Tax=Flammeovirga sp. EKP202 TaxID=2770592 RepID=UPI00165FFE3F|nr:class I SAM-dependent methyltransferase [Flammeovirga sp. EKP202]MBD0404834.1 class I SAM-dependent methyltransferase [Flammeovirga sp. EKP202]